jgi:dCTP deaminase
MILKGDEIARLLESGSTAQDPFVVAPHPDLGTLKASGSASLDLRLGTWFLSLKTARVPYLTFGAQGAGSQISKTTYVPFGNEYVLHPGKFVLCVTLEWIRLPGNLAAYVIGRSSWGRRGLVIATATGVHPGFKGCLTLELGNLGELPMAIKPGAQICQLFLHRVETQVPDSIDKSAFVGLRRPTLGTIDLDPVAEKLAAAAWGRER